MPDSLSPADPLPGSQTPGYLRSIYDGAIAGDFSDNPAPAKSAAQIGVGLVPIAGQLADARDTMASIREIRRGESGGWTNLGFAVAGWIPAAGDLVKSLRKAGVEETFGSIGAAFGSVRETWSKLWRTGDERLGEAGPVMYRPGTDLAADDLPPGTLGSTNRYGDIQIRDGLDAAVRQSTLDHEMVHRFFSPKFLFGQDFRANLGLLGYLESHLLRRTEEGLAEAWARFRKDGISGIAEGWRFPLERPYGIDSERLRIERNIIIGTAGTALSAGSEIGDRLAAQDAPARPAK